MALNAITSTTRRVQYTGNNSTTSFAFTFVIEAAADIAVYFDGTKKTLTTHYTVTIGSDGTGSITTTTGNTPGTGVLVTIIGDRSISRTTAFTSGGPLTAASLENELNSQTLLISQLSERVDRAFTLPINTDATTPLELPYNNTESSNANRIIAFNSSGNAFELGSTTTNIDTLAGIASDITTVSSISSNVTSVAGDATDIGTVAGAISNVNTLAAISSNITSVAGVASLITSDFVSDLNTLATTDIVNDLNLLATSDFVSDLNSLATSDFVSDLNALEAIKTDVSTVASNISNVSSFAAIYRIGSSDPSSSLDEGDLFYNSTDNKLKFYNGSAWVSLSDSATLITVADESSDTSCNVLFTTAATGDLGPKTGTNFTFNSSSGALTATSFVGALTGNVTGNVSGSSGSTTGNAATATALETARNIGGVSFDGTGNIDLAGVNTAGNQNTSGTAAGLSATLGVSSGGTGATSLTANGALIGNGTGAVTAVDMSTKGHLLAGDGSGNPSTLSVGTNTHVLTADSSEATGLKWAAAAAAGATGAGGDEVFVENERVVTTNYTLSTNKSAMCVGPLTINTGVTVSIPSGERLVIL